jgi:ABC-type transporter Mla subunit MlaD
MKYTFHPFERAVGVFLLVTLLGSFFVGAGIAVKKNWFEEKIFFYGHIESASNIRVGSSVFMAGLKIGKIEDVDFDSTNKLRLKFSVLKKYSGNITRGSMIQFTRPFLIGDKVLSIVRNEETKTTLPTGSFLAVAEKLDVMDVLSGQKVNELMGRLDSITKNMDELVLTGKNIALQVGEKEKVKKLMNNLTFASQQLKHSPQMMKDASVILSNLNQVTTELNDLRPLFVKVARDLPQGGQKTLELLDESITTIKAMQKNYFLKDHVQSVKKEEDDKKRSVASEKSP